MFMKRLISGLLLAVASASYAHAQTDVFLCLDANGNKEYKNTGITKGCKRVDLPAMTMIPAPAPVAEVRKPSVQTASSRPSASPSDFPKVDSATQKARDSDRKQILQDEMKMEEGKLANLKKSFNGGEPERQGDERNYAKYQERVASMKEDISRTEKNVEALKRELGNLK